MAFTLASITPRVRSRLNDQIAAVYTDAVLLPFAVDAVDELQLELELNGGLVLQKRGTALTVGTTVTSITYASTPALPADLLEPLNLEERLSGSSDMYVPLIRRQWTPDVLPTDSLRYYDWREQALFFIGATSARQLRIDYLKRALTITTISDSITINNSQMFLIDRIAALAARYIGSNPTRADELDQEAEINLNKLTRIAAKAKQGVRTRRRPFTLVGRRSW